MEMAERMGYIFHPSPYPLSFLYSTRSISHFPSPFRWNYISPATFSLSTLSRIFDAVVFSLSNRFINFQPKALTPDRVFFFFFYFFFFSFSFFPISCICATVSQPFAGFGIFIFLEIPAGNRFRRDFLFFNGYLPS